MLIAPLSFRAEFPLPAGMSLPALAAHYTAALQRCRASVSAAGEDELQFRVSLRAPEWLGLNAPDLGMLVGGTIELEVRERVYVARLRVQPRSWVLALAIVPWAAALAALGIVTTPWRYLLAFGGLPLVAVMWLVVWGNVRTFLDHTHAAIAGGAGTG